MGPNTSLRERRRAADGPAARPGTAGPPPTIAPVCGIAGVVADARPSGDGRLAPMLAALGHRGPDGQGQFEAGGVGLAHTRLAIIDPTAASDQPMLDEATGCALVFNGEIYNYRELREELRRSGHHFRSAGDTEVLLRAYLGWGEGCLDRLNGMFAFALWDPRRGEVLLARDRLGEKPLQLCRHDGALWFASEVKALLAAGLAPAAPNHPYLLRFLALGDLGHPVETPFASVTQLPAGHCAWVSPGPTVRTRPYWRAPEPIPEGAAVGDVAGAFADLFVDSVDLRLRSDVPLGTSLSGGLDSSAVLATVRRHHPEGELHAFTASFPGTAADELPRARLVAERLGVTIHPVPLGAADLDTGLEAMITANEGPVESPSTFAQFEVMREAAKAGITVLLDGQGADETWTGYEKYVGLAVVDRFVTGRPAAGVALARQWRSVRGGLPRAPLGRYAALLSGSTVRARLGSLGLRVQGRWLADGYRRAHRGDPLDGNPLGRARFGGVSCANARADLDRITLPRLLRYADRNSMAWSREVRLPFLDHRLVELAARTPFDQKVVRGWSKEPVRRLLEDLGLPEVARRRDKRAYMPPNDQWMAYPAIDARVRAGWADLHRAGVLAHPEPSGGAIRRWRVLAVATWASAFGVSLG